MKREFLTKELGLSKDMCDKIMAQYGESINKLKEENGELLEKVAAYESEVAKADETKAALNSIIAEKDELLATCESLKNELSGSKLGAAISRSLLLAGAKNLTACEALLKKDKLTITDDEILGLNEQIEEIKKECDYLFYDSNISSGMAHGPQGSKDDGFTHFARAGAKLN